MEAREYLDLLKDEKAILYLAYYEGDQCDGRSHAVILDEEDQIAVMLENCGNKKPPQILAGDFVKYVLHPEAEPKIVGTPARLRS